VLVDKILHSPNQRERRKVENGAMQPLAAPAAITIAQEVALVVPAALVAVAASQQAALAAAVAVLTEELS